MGDNTNMNAQVAAYVILSSLLQIPLEILVLAIELDVICLSSLDAICSYALLVRITSLISIIYHVFSTVISNQIVSSFAYVFNKWLPSYMKLALCFFFKNGI
jgi:hypothetical protein